MNRHWRYFPHRKSAALRCCLRRDVALHAAIDRAGIMRGAWSRHVGNFLAVTRHCRLGGDWRGGGARPYNFFSTEAAAPSPESEAKIAPVEDDPDVFFATSELLTGWGYQVFGGLSAEAAIDGCTANACGKCPDLVLSAFTLPHAKTAVDVIMGFNRHFDSKILAIVVSGDPSAARDVTVEGLEFEILQKPIRAAKLRALVRYTLENSS